MTAGTPLTADAELILARANLGALVERAMQLGLSVFHDTYETSARAPRDKGGKPLEAPELMMERLRLFYRDEFWLPEQSARWDPWVQKVQRRRNSVHAFQDRDLGDHADFLNDTRITLRL